MSAERLSELSPIAPSSEVDARVRRRALEAMRSARRAAPVTLVESLMHVVVVGSYAVYAVSQVVRIVLG